MGREQAPPKKDFFGGVWVEIPEKKEHGGSVSNFLKALASDEIIIFDGAMGTLLQGRGLSPGESPEIFGLQNPQAIVDVHRQYLQAGSQVITTNTFGGTRFKLPPNTDVYSLNKEMARLARTACEEFSGTFAAGSIGPTGKFTRPSGDLSTLELTAAFKEQIEGLIDGGVDLLVAETHYDLTEAQTIILAAREIQRERGLPGIPLAICMTFEPTVSLTGTPAHVFAAVMSNMGVDLAGTNCSQGPEEMSLVINDWLPYIRVPFFVKPNAGLPILENDQTVFKMGPVEFASSCMKLVEMGAKAVSGCCGTTPEHIAALVSAIGTKKWKRSVSGLPANLANGKIYLTSRTSILGIGPGEKTAIIGERINPTGKKVLAAELKAGEYSTALKLAAEQVEKGVSALDVNVGAPMAREEVILPELIRRLIGRFSQPLSIDSSNIQAIGAALWELSGTPLVNSISAEKDRFELIAPLCLDFGAPFILLPLRGDKLPESAEDRLKIVEELLKKSLDLGFNKNQILVDVLALTVSSSPGAAVQCFQVIRECRERFGLSSVIGLSNISFGLPARELVNSTFLAMCMTEGLSAFIGNPGSVYLRQALDTAELLLGRDREARNFISSYGSWSASGQSGSLTPANPSSVLPPVSPGNELRKAVVAGIKEDIFPILELALQEGQKPGDLLNNQLIPGIMDVGELYERKEYFLPQLLASAETMNKAFEKLKPLLHDQGNEQNKVKIVLATVEGDIHDIGKNIVGLMLRNHGFDVIDLGKDVPAEQIVKRAKEEGAKIIGLSALMTTTMVRMGDTIRLLNEEGLKIKVMVGGAVVTKEYAQSIGADGYSEDAVEAVKLAKRLSCEERYPSYDKMEVRI